jgi:hypothetical protein
MATTNKASAKGVTKTTTGKTRNKAGGRAFQLNDINKLMTGVLTSFFREPKYYGDTSEDLIETARRVVKKDPEFVAKLAAFARSEFHLRTISQVLLAELAKSAKGSAFVRQATHKVIERADDMSNVLAYYLDTFGKPITRSLRRGLADVFPKFDEYQLDKYKGTKKKVKLRDVLLVARPKPKNKEQEAVWKRLIENRTTTAKTRETVLAKKGNTAEVWEELVSEGKLGYMAALRNLKNMLETNAKCLSKVLDMIKDEKAVLNSKQLPFRFFSAYKMVEEVGHTRAVKVLDTLEDALEISVANLPKIPGTTFMTADNSGSMGSPLSARSIVRYTDVGNLLMSVAHKFCDEAITSVFAEGFKVVNVSTRSGILANMQKFAKTDVGHSTYLYKAINYLLKNKIKVDRVIVFSDMQAYTDAGYGFYNSEESTSAAKVFAKYRKQVNPDCWMHSIDLSGYGDTQFAGNKVNLIAGWSDKVLGFIKTVEAGEEGLIERVRKYSLN